MIGKTISHYKIVDKLGEGGMGAVYKAEDTTLRRLVALKVLSSQMADDEEARERFVREAQAASALNHASITTVYELLEDEGEQFIVMEYVEGKTIRDMVESSHVSIRKALDIIIQAAEALDAAHNKGILHRDVKSANIMVSMEGNVKVMDFGLAHLEERSQLTRTGTTMGTLAYSSPEQLTGRPVDRKSEIFSLGCVFYELLTGQLPFKSPSEGELVFEIINNEQDSPSELRKDVPENVEAVVTKMLDKKPELRYQSCRDLISDLNAIRSELETTTVEISTSLDAIRAKRKKLLAIGTAAVVVIAAVVILLAGRGGPELDPNRIFVTVFENQTGDESLDVLGKYLASIIAGDIERADLLRTVDFESVARILQAIEESGSPEERSNPLQTIAQEYNAGTAITGSIFSPEERTVQFILNIKDMESGETLHSIKPISGPAENWQELAERLSQQVMGGLASLFQQQFEDWVMSTGHYPNYDAFREFSIGMELFVRDSVENIPYFYRAAELDTVWRIPLLWAVRAHKSRSGITSSLDSEIVKHHAAADSILTVLDNLQTQWAPMVQLQFNYLRASCRNDYDSAYQIAIEAQKLAPNTFWDYEAGMHAFLSGRYSEAVEFFKETDTESVVYEHWTGYYLIPALHMLGDYRGELKASRRGLLLFPDRGYLIRGVVRASAALGRFDELNDILSEKPAQIGLMQVAALELRAHGYSQESEELLERVIQWYKAQEPIDRPGLAWVLYAAERFEEARTLYQELATEYPKDLENSGYLGAIAARLGEREEALRISRWLAEVGNEHIGGYHTYRRACIAAQLGDLDVAMGLLNEARDQGYFTIYSFHRDIDLEPLRDHPGFQEFIPPED